MTDPAPPADLFRRLVATSPDGILVVNRLRIEFANAAAAALRGVNDPAVLVGTPLYDLFRADSHPALRGCLERIGDAELSVSGEAVFERCDGPAIDVDIRAARLVPGDPSLLQLVVRDGTERRRAEQALRQSEERLRLAFAGAREGVWDWNLETGHVIYSSRWKEMLGYADDEIPPNVGAWEALLHPDDKIRADRLYEDVARRHGAYEAEFRLRHKDGHYVTVLSRGLPIRRAEDGRVVRIVGMHLDITEQKQTEHALRESEERLRLAFAGALEGIWDWDLETDRVVYSSRWKQMLGYADEEIEPHISAWERLVHPDDRKAADDAHESVTRGRPTYQAEFRLRHKDGHYVPVLSRGFPVRRTPGGPVVRIVGTHFDLTERRQREAERARTELLAQMVFMQEDERRRIARDMHDQFGEHLTALSLQIGALREAAASRADLTAYVDALDGLAGRLDHDVEQLVWQLRPTALDDLGLRAALANYVEEWSRRHGVAAELHSSGLMAERLSSEVETALYRIAQEALNNVAKHAKATRVDVLLERRADCVQLIVEDDGVGFDQTAMTARRDGFGLVGMQERATMVGATLDIDSAPGRGTTILVRMAAAATGAEVPERA